MDRNIEYLLHKYESRDVNESWSAEHNKEYMRNIRINERLDLLDGIINERKTISKGNFRFTPMQRSRANYLIRNVYLNMGGKTSIEQSIVMIIVYVKLETDENRKLKDYYPLLNDYNIPIQTFVKFLIKLNKFHISKIPIRS